MKFIADTMLGRLAGWMRAIGCDVSYYRKIDDGELVELAIEEGRIILTRDTLLIKRRKARGNFFFIQGDSFKEQLKQVADAFPIDPYCNLLTRCIECNIPLREIEKGMVRDRVPEYVYTTQESFRECPGCAKIYWPATHREHIIRMLDEIFKEMPKIS